MLDKFFGLRKHNTDIKTEMIGGITTFITMAYILAVNPQILSATGMDKNAILIATAIAAFVGTFFMALFANYPFALAPGLGLNAYFAYTVCGEMGYGWEIALLAVFVEGILFIALSLLNIREAIIFAIPMQLKSGISVGIGLFITFIGLQNAGLVIRSDATLVTVVNFRQDFQTQGVGALLALVGLFLIILFSVKKIKGSILLGILITWGLGMLCEMIGLYKVNVSTEHFSLFPVWNEFNLGAIKSTFGRCFNVDWRELPVFEFLVIVFSLMFVDLFNTLGAVIGVVKKAKLLDEEGRVPRMKRILLADAVATSAGAILGTSTTTTFVESAAGVSAGARTGLASIFTGLLFLLSIFLAPVFCAIPGFATAPALIYVGFLMVSEIIEIKFDDITEAIPAYLCLIGMPLFYSISEGIAFGIISYIVINLITGKRKKITPLMYILGIVFLMKYIWL